jgi:hypothetical protein
VNITLVNDGLEHQVDVPLGSNAGMVRRLHDALEEIGAPSSYTLSVNGESATDETILTPGARVGFRPTSASKG